MAKLTALKVANAKPGKHEDGTVPGLRLYVSETGAKKWVLRIFVQGRRRELGLGGFPRVSLKEAEAKAAEWREVVRLGGDPTKAPLVPVLPSFAKVAGEYIDSHSAAWGSAKHAAQWVTTLSTYAEPTLGAIPVHQVTTEDVLKVLAPIWNTKTETAKRLQGRIENVLDYAIAMKWRESANPARWRGHLSMLLPSPRRVATVAHHSAMDYNHVAQFMAALAKREDVPALALRFLILTAARTGEVLGATWGEIDLEAAVWTVPASRMMKAGREHRVPLSRAALGVLEALPRFVGNDYLFPGTRAYSPIGRQSMGQLMDSMGELDAVPHGFRSCFRDWAGEVSSFPRDVSEMALSHVIESKVEAAYRRGDLFEKRRKLMDAWADWCTDGLLPTP